MRFSRRQIILAGLVVFLCVWVSGTLRLRAVQRDVRNLSSSVADIGAEIATAQAELENRRQEFVSAEAEQQSWLTLAAQTEFLAAAAAPESQWAAPPEGEITWNPKSPYIWLPKESLNSLQLKNIAFTASGQITAQMATILALDENQSTELNNNLSSLLRDFRASQAANIRPLAKLPPEMANLEGPTAGIVVDHLPEMSLRFQELYLSTLEATLGEQRATLLSAIVKDRLTPPFKVTVGAPTTIAVIRNPDGSFNMLTRSGGNLNQMSVRRPLEAYLPPYLLPYFATLIGSTIGIGEGL